MTKVLEDKKQLECRIYGICNVNDKKSVTRALQQVSEFGLKILSSNR